jgi:hypothetical protein
MVDAQELNHLRVEEIELSDDKTQWLVTLGWVEPGSRTVGTGGLYVRPAVEALPRVYKLFPVDAESGEVSTMKMRD